VGPGPAIPSQPSLLLTAFFPRTLLALADELPSTIKALNDGWLASYQISTVVVRALFTWRPSKNCVTDPLLQSENFELFFA